VILRIILKALRLVLFMMMTSSFVPGCEKESSCRFEPARLLEIYIAVPSGVTAILSGFVMMTRLPSTKVLLTEVKFQTRTSFSMEPTKKGVPLPMAACSKS